MLAIRRKAEIMKDGLKAAICSDSEIRPTRLNRTPKILFSVPKEHPHFPLQ